MTNLDQLAQLIEDRWQGDTSVIANRLKQAIYLLHHVEHEHTAIESSEIMLVVDTLFELSCSLEE